MKRRKAAPLKTANAHHYQASNVINLVDNTSYKKRPRVQIYPKNLSQEDYLLKLNDPQKMIVFATGPAGTGKTMLAVQWAVDQLKYGDASKIIITRPAV